MKCLADVWISIHEALASLDNYNESLYVGTADFDPRGSCEPRRIFPVCFPGCMIFRSTRLLRASTLSSGSPGVAAVHFDPRGSCEPRRHVTGSKKAPFSISIHEALASLDLRSFFSEDQAKKFRSTRLLRASTSWHLRINQLINDFDPRGSCEPRPMKFNDKPIRQ